MAEDPRRVLKLEKDGVYVDGQMTSDVAQVKAARYRLTQGRATPEDRAMLQQYENIFKRSLEER